MKSLDVCERTQNKSRDTEGREKRENRKNKGKESMNGGNEGKRSKSVICGSESLQNGDKKYGETPSVRDSEMTEGDDESNGISGNLGGKTSAEEGRESRDCRSPEEKGNASSSEDPLKILSLSKLNCSEGNSDLKGECASSCEESRSNVNGGDECEARKDKNTSKDVKNVAEISSEDSSNAEESCNDKAVVGKETEDDKSIDMDEDTILDSDCDKENEKGPADDEVDGLGTDKDESQVSLEDTSSGCEIQVGECQTISGSVKNFLWTENDSKKCQVSGEKSASSSNVIPDPNLEESGKGGGRNKCSGEDEVVTETEEVVEEKKKVVECKQTKGEVAGTNGEGKKEEDLDESYSNKTDTDSEDERCSAPQGEYANSRKRRLSSAAKLEAETKKPKSEFGDETTNHSNATSEHESANDSSPSGFSSCRDTETPAVTDECGAEMKKKKRASSTVKNAKKLKTSGEETVRLNTQETVPSSVLPNLRGTLKSLTRGDLEELIVQKLCEVITERSVVGELRRKAQALEEDQERWRTKVRSLTKQMREMEMVMKKYMAEVQKQVKENDSEVVNPIKVTRSVGLQVSFYTSSSRQTKPNLSLSTSSSLQTLNGKNMKAVTAKLLPQVTSSPVTRSKPATAIQKIPNLSQSLTPQTKKTVATRSDSSAITPKGPAVPCPSPLNGSRLVQSQYSPGGVKVNYKPTTAVQTPQQQQQQIQQNGSKVIDLTDDDDKQPGNVVKSPIRLVHHLPQQTQVQPNSGFTYFLPKTNSPATGTTTPAQSRQVLIATPTVPQQNSRQVMCQMPPLLFKGGNIVQSGPQPQSPSQPQAQTQTQTPSPNSRVLLPKALRHPAPLPLPPTNAVVKGNLKLLPPRPALKISKVQTGIVLSWNMTLGPEHAPISSYQLYAYQESNSPPMTSLWKKVGDVKALPLPMACTLTQFMSGHKYHFAVRAVDHHCRVGPFSFPGTIILVK